MKRTNYLLLIFSLILIIVGLLIFIPCWSIETKSLISQYAGILVTGIGFIIAIYQYFDDVNKRKKDFLDLEVETKKDTEYYSIKTQVFNKSGENKDIDFSLILLTEQDKSVLQLIQSVIDEKQWNIKIGCTNDLNKLKKYVEEPLFYNSIGIIPLSFYFNENIRIGNESPCYTYTFHRSVGLKKGIYSARFFIYPKVGYHRSTVDSLVIE